MNRFQMKYLELDIFKESLKIDYLEEMSRCDAEIS